MVMIYSFFCSIWTIEYR